MLPRDSLLLTHHPPQPTWSFFRPLKFCWVDNRSKMSTPAPFDSSGIVGKLTFDYVRPLLRKGSAKPLQEADLEPIANRDNVAANIRKVTLAWDIECRRAAAASCQPWLLRALASAFKADLIVGSILSWVEDGSILAQVLLIRPLLSFIVSDRPALEGYQLATALGALSLFQAVLHHQNFLVNMRLGWSLRIAVGVVRLNHSESYLGIEM